MYRYFMLLCEYGTDLKRFHAFMYDVPEQSVRCFC
jgi:hypothetical protein